MTSDERQPWDTDRELTLEMATAAIAEAVPEFAGREVRLLGAGWDFDAYEVEDEWVFKFPRRIKEVERLERELAVLALLDGTLEVPIPLYAWPLLYADTFPYAFSGYRKLPGRPLFGLPPTPERVQTVAKPLGRFLEQLHAVDFGPARAVLSTAADSGSALSEMREKRRRVLSAVAECASADLSRRVDAWWNDPKAVPVPYEGPACLIHDDLHGEHLLVDETTGLDLMGVIDWGDTALGDPAGDFAGFAAWGGLPALDALLAAYPRPLDGLVERVRFLAAQLCAIEVDYFHRTEQPDHVAHSLAILETLVP